MKTEVKAVILFSQETDMVNGAKRAVFKSEYKIGDSRIG